MMKKISLNKKAFSHTICKTAFFLPVTLLIILSSCNNGENVGNIPLKKEPLGGIRIAWDHRTLNRVAPQFGQPNGYYGYSRMIQLQDGRLACIYETSAGNIELTFSQDEGTDWSWPVTVFSGSGGINMAVPEIIELDDHSILAACNPRPVAPYTDDRRFGIRVRKSTDCGKTWGENQLIYEAQQDFENGCWEPSFLQLPNGEVQLYFSNEGIYLNSGEQNISIFRSNDRGESWTSEPEIVGFRAGKRDGMPVAVYIPQTGEILVSVEDNKQGEFKPAIYHEGLENNWSDGFVSADDTRRSYQPLYEKLGDNIYAGGPYLRQLERGEVMMSYQTTFNRTTVWDRSAMAVEISDDYGDTFSRRSFPFIIALDKWGLWNSLGVINGNTPVALTSTNAWSDVSTEVWMIKGKVLDEIEIPAGTPAVDGLADDACWQGPAPVFVGHKGEAWLEAYICIDANNLNLLLSVNDPEILTGTTTASLDGVIFQFDSEREGYIAPHTGIFQLKTGPDGSTEFMEGAFGSWETVSSADIITTTLKSDTSYIIECSVPRTLINIPAGNNYDPGINFVLKNSTATENYSESISSNDSGEPYTWLQVHISE